MSLRLLNQPAIEYEHLVWCPTCKYGIVIWTSIAVEGNVSHGCMTCDGPMQIFHRCCPFTSPIRREAPQSGAALSRSDGEQPLDAKKPPPKSTHAEA